MLKLFLYSILMTGFLFAETVVEEGPKSKTEIATQPGSVNVTVEHKEIVSEKTEKVIIDKELTDNVIKKFEEADKRRQKATDSELGAFKEELDYLKKEREKLERSDKGNDEFKRTIDKRIASLEIRMRRIEKYLAMDETMVDYYKRERSPWDLVWRSAVFPGWGHRYAKEEYTGNTYSTTILVLLGIGYFIQYQVGAAKDAANTTLYNNAVVRTLQYSSLGIPANFSNTFLYSSFATYNSAMSAIDSQSQLSSNFINGAIALYFIQLVHVYFTGVEWAKVQPRDYSSEELLKPSSFNFRSKPDNNHYSLTQEKGVRYELEVLQRF